MKLADVFRLVVRDPEIRDLIATNPKIKNASEDELVEMMMIGASTEAAKDLEARSVLGAIKRIANKIYDMGVAAGRAN
jgi:hypothetical protein